MTPEELARFAAENDLPWNDTMAQRFSLYAGMLKEENEKINLTAITEPGEVYEKHFADCLLPLKQPQIRGRIADVGSGAGFPGVVFAIARPDLAVDLIEPTQKKCRFLEQLITALQLSNVQILCRRAEEYREGREVYDVVCARAVAPLPVLSELCLPLTRVGGTFLAMKGPGAEVELQACTHALQVLGAGKPAIVHDTLPSGQRVQLLIPKERPTPPQYPRAYARLKKNPL